ncbi:MAG: pyridoxamine 5'-phosphate oxidase [Saprospiraceae bacterium]
MNVADLRRAYALAAFSEQDAAADPFEQFGRWFDEALNAQLHEPNAMTLATADATGRPSARTVLLKGFDARGFVFYTNYNSRKGQDLSANPYASLLFWWGELERQVRIEGPVEKVSEGESEAYFQSRPRDSQLGAWASPQSQVIVDRGVIETTMADLKSTYADQPVLPLPPHWGGYRVIPDHFEFWQGRESRLHDRIRYTPLGDGWVLDRLAP